KGNEKLVGTICIWQISEEQSKAEIGFELLPEFQRKGIMKEAVPAVINFGFEKLGLSFIEGEVAPGNTSSIKILEKNKFKLVPGSDLNAETVIYQLTK
ncbi:MAG TPA: GNAT family N-acetyltransferase, partial [Ignavibacteriaceae bacterium]|nr:GNAT family N-acetyltransferase [Ignavibacteriaceae bacterium]